MSQIAVTLNAFLPFLMPLECKRCIFLQSSVFGSHSNVVLVMTSTHLEDTEVLLFSVRVIIVITESSQVGFPCMAKLSES